MLVTIGTIYVGTNYYTGRLAPQEDLLSAQLNWGDTSTVKFEVLSSMNSTGALIAVIFSGVFLPLGRRKSYFLAYFFVLSGVVLTEIETYPTKVAGGILHGISAGILQVTSNRYIEEYVPLAMYGTASPFNIFCGQFGVFLGNLTGIFYQNDSPEELATTQVWRYIDAGSALFATLTIISLLTLVRTDSPKFYLSRNDEAGAMQAVHAIY